MHIANHLISSMSGALPRMVKTKPHSSEPHHFGRICPLYSDLGIGLSRKFLSFSNSCIATVALAVARFPSVPLSVPRILISPPENPLSAETESPDFQLSEDTTKLAVAWFPRLTIYSWQLRAAEERESRLTESNIFLLHYRIDDLNDGFFSDPVNPNTPMDSGLVKHCKRGMARGVDGGYFVAKRKYEPIYEDAADEKTVRQEEKMRQRYDEEEEEKEMRRKSVSMTDTGYESSASILGPVEEAEGELMDDEDFPPLAGQGKMRAVPVLSPTIGKSWVAAAAGKVVVEVESTATKVPVRKGWVVLKLK